MVYSMPKHLMQQELSAGGCKIWVVCRDVAAQIAQVQQELAAAQAAADAAGFRQQTARQEEQEARQVWCNLAGLLRSICMDKCQDVVAKPAGMLCTFTWRLTCKN